MTQLTATQAPNKPPDDQTIAALPELAATLPLAAVQDLTLANFPGTPASLWFLRGCNMACDYCHNAHIRSAGPRLPLRPALLRLLQRQARVPGIVISGGEPTIHAGLPALVQFLHAAGLQVKLDTNGSRPAVLRQLLQAKVLRYVALDVKTRLDDAAAHDDLTGRSGYAPRVRAALHVLRHHLPADRWEVRTTVCGGRHNAADLAAIAADLLPGNRWFLQAMRRDGTSPCARQQSTPPEPGLLAGAAAAAIAAGIDARVR